jgi:hypothetical protein
MPYSGEHTARLMDPSQFDRFARKNDEFGPGIDAIYGIKDGKAHLQAIRFDKEKFTPAEAKKWVEDHGHKMIAFEPAGKANRSVRSNLAVPMRQETFEERRHMVVPVVMLTEGVHAGNGGPFFYGEDELSKLPESWNGVPVPVWHPEDTNGAISANSPQVLEARSIGRIFNVLWDAKEKKLRGEVWIDIVKAEKVEKKVLEMLMSGEPIEVSTSLWSDDDDTPGEWNGEKFNGTVHNIVPDHLALLPGGEGACNWNDGCGIRLNSTAPSAHEVAQEATVEVANEKEEESKMAEPNAKVEALIACECTRFTANDKDWLEKLTDEQLDTLKPMDKPPEVAGAVTETPIVAAQVEVADATPEPVTPAAPMTVAEFIAGAPAAIADFLKRAVAREEAMKEALVTGLMANKRSKFTVNELRGMNIDTLERMTELGKEVSYGARGGAAPVTPEPPVPQMPSLIEAMTK